MPLSHGVPQTSNVLSSFICGIIFKSIKFTFMATNLQNNPLELPHVSCIINPCNNIGSGENHLDMIAF